MGKVIVTDQTFDQEVLQEKGRPVLVDFWAEWCYPCKTQGPIVEELAQSIGDKAKVTKMDVDENPTVSGKFNILSIPTLIIFKDGNVVWQGVGLHQKGVLEAELNKHV